MIKIFLILSASLSLFGQSWFADQSSFKFHTHKGCEYLKINAYDEAITEFEEALKQNPENSEAHSNLAFARLMKHTDLAIRYHKKDLEFDPDDDGARRDLALLYHRLGMREEAIKEYKILKKENSVLVPGLKQIFEPAQ